MAAPGPGRPPTWALSLPLQLLPLLPRPGLRVEGPPGVVSGDDLPVERALQGRTGRSLGLSCLCAPGPQQAVHPAPATPEGVGVQPQVPKGRASGARLRWAEATALLPQAPQSS